MSTATNCRPPLSSKSHPKGLEASLGGGRYPCLRGTRATLPAYAFALSCPDCPAEPQSALVPMGVAKAQRLAGDRRKST